ncbi:MAG: uroporphyrinogen decarboxylase [Actinomycetota bacterium]
MSASPNLSAESPFLAAANGRKHLHTPVWFMRQAGRSLPEYKAIRGSGSILEAIKQPALATEITLQPFLRYGVDAAVLYAPGTGPVAENAFRSPDDLKRLRPLEADDVSYVIETVKLLVAELPTSVPLLAFAGAPFTVASYLIEGRPSRTYQNTKRMIHLEPELWHQLMERLVQHSVTFIDAQLSAGARAFQLFDSWAGSLSNADYREFVLPHSKKVFQQLRELHPEVAGIHFGIGCDHLLESMYEAGPRIIGLDWRTPIQSARKRMGTDLVVQGNLDPALVLAGSQAALEGAEHVLDDNANHPGHIFNLGHGVDPTTDPAVLEDVVAFVHEKTRVEKS